jgi:hypothetical protein
MEDYGNELHFLLEVLILFQINSEQTYRVGVLKGLNLLNFP